MSRIATQSTVVVIDDTPDICSVLELALQFEGFKCVIFTDREAALAAFSTLSPDIILMDYCMPGMPAREFLQTVRQRHPQVITVLMTSVVEPNRYAQELGIELCLPKPFDYDKLVDLLKACVSKRTIRPTRRLSTPPSASKAVLPLPA